MLFKHDNTNPSRPQKSGWVHVEYEGESYDWATNCFFFFFVLKTIKKRKTGKNTIWFGKTLRT